MICLFFASVLNVSIKQHSMLVCHFTIISKAKHRRFLYSSQTYFSTFWTSIWYVTQIFCQHKTCIFLISLHSKQPICELWNRFLCDSKKILKWYSTLSTTLFKPIFAIIRLVHWHTVQLDTSCIILYDSYNHIFRQSYGPYDMVNVDHMIWWMDHVT